MGSRSREDIVDPPGHNYVMPIGRTSLAIAKPKRGFGTILQSKAAPRVVSHKVDVAFSLIWEVRVSALTQKNVRLK